MLTISIIFVLLSNAFTSRRDLSLYFNRSLIIVLLITLLLAINSNNFIVLKEGISILGGLFHNSNLTITFHVFILFISLVILQLTAFLPKKYINNNMNPNNRFMENLLSNLQYFDKNKEQYSIIEYPLVIVFIILGAIFIISSSDIISVFISIELQSYGLYLLCSLYRNSELSTGAGLTYFLLGGLSSCFILLASGILYANSGTTNLEGYYILANLSNVNQSLYNIIYWYDNNYINYSLVILSLGFLFKISAAPFHFWSPDVYDAIPTVVTTFVANVAKISLLIFLIDIVHHSSNLEIFNFNWTYCLLISSFLSLIIGTVLGLNQSRVKRLLAYSTISHIGFILLGISINSIESMQAFIFYLMQYSISNINIFMILVSIGYTIYIPEKQEKTLSEQDNSPVQYIAQLRGYFYVNPVLAISLAIVMYSFVGVPPLIGFFGKQMILSSALDKGYVFISLIAILTSVISAVYYLNIIKEIFFEKPEDQLSKNKDYTVTLSTSISVFVSIFTLIILLFIFSPQQWLSITNILAIYIFT
uniref:NADH-ubiquinone oxidoreductase chain 2 n=1 Tax=Gomphillus americanus TaxID=1940652 RepID=A0A1Y9TKP1_9LECA|nr:NADH dehydrogenase subunit 2 [Gomphillus americanus]ARO90074.1 NADH dehydrogenase subunit 2 [Gomphillus americanus]